MRIEIIAVGSEILSGQAVNTNASYISEKLLHSGYPVMQHLVVADDKKLIKKALNEAMKRSEIVIVTGGLGPTVDDITKKTVCDFLKIDLEKNSEIENLLKSKFGNISSIEEQATVPKSAFILKNDVGTAPGMIFLHNNKAIILLPGVPQEMKMMLPQAINFILEKFPLQTRIFTWQMSICLVSEVKIDAALKEVKNKNLQFGIYPKHGLVQVVLKTNAETKEKAKQLFAPVEKKLSEEFSCYILSHNTLEESIEHLFLSKKRTLFCAESCTGGALSAKLVHLPGASGYFLGAAVSYSNDIKTDLLKVQGETIKSKGAVSVETVKEMANGALNLSGADYTVAISGIAGPGGATEDKPVGTVCIAIACKHEKVDAGILHFAGSREVVIEFAVKVALGILYRRLAHNLFHFEK